jgi:hypothetical protein
MCMYGVKGVNRQQFAREFVMPGGEEREGVGPPKNVRGEHRVRRRR